MIREHDAPQAEKGDAERCQGDAAFRQCPADGLFGDRQPLDPQPRRHACGDQQDQSKNKGQRCVSWISACGAVCLSFSAGAGPGGHCFAIRCRHDFPG